MNATKTNQHEVVTAPARCTPPLDRGSECPNAEPVAYEPPRAFDIGTLSNVNGQMIGQLFDFSSNRYI